MKGKVAIVTGSSRGIGKAIALELAKKGFNIVVNSRKQNDIQKFAKELNNTTKIKSIAVVADVRQQNEVQKLIRDTIKEFKRIDVLVNNAGVVIEKPLTKTTDKEYEFVLDTNLKGVFLCCKEVLPYMISQGSGSIINISSGAGKSGYAELSVYCASKFGVIGLTESLADEVRKYGIRVVSICPGSVATDMQKQFMTEAEYERRKNSMTQPEEVAKVVLNAINGKYKTGSSIDVY